jgi:hypothetical protein
MNTNRAACSGRGCIHRHGCLRHDLYADYMESGIEDFEQIGPEDCKYSPPGEMPFQHLIRVRNSNERRER